MKIRIITLLGALVFLTNCAEELPILDIQISPESDVINAMEPLKFNIKGQADFLVFYSGLNEQKFEDYPNAIARSIDMFNPNPNFSFAYNMHGEVEAVFVASSYGNWSEIEEEKIFRFKINVVDNIASLSSVMLKTPGIFGKEFVGEIIANENRAVVSIPSNYSISNLTLNISAKSPRAKIYLDDELFINNSVVDFSDGPLIFNVKSIGGEQQDWKVEINRS